MREIVDQQTGEILTVNASLTPKILVDADSLREERFSLLNRIQAVLRDNKFRVSRCHRFSTAGASVFYSPKFNRTHLANVVTCGSVWICPVCSTKIISKRAQVLEEMINHHLHKDGCLYFVTLTTPHSITLALTDSLACWKRALTSFHAHRTFKDFSIVNNVCGHVRSLEITFSKINGWHVHCHYLFFTKFKNDFINAFSCLTPLWIKLAKASGFDEPNHKSIHVRNADNGGAEYLAKWGAHDELLKSNFKKSRSSSSYTPFQLINSAFQSRFIEYAYATTAAKDGIKRGMSFIAFSRSLKKYLSSIGFSYVEKTDEELVNEIENKSAFVTSIPPEKLKYLAMNNMLNSYLISAKHGKAAADDFLNAVFKGV